MEASKKFLLVIVIISFIPLLLIFTFFAFRFKAEKESRQRSLKQGVEEKANSSGGIRSLELAIQKLADYPLLWQYLDQISRASAENKEPDLLKKKEAIYKHIEEFKSRYPEFEEIMVKNPSEGRYCLKVPPEASGEDRPGSRMVIVAPIPHADTNRPALLLGFARIDPALWPEAAGKRLLLSGSRRKLVMFFIWFFLLISILIPLVMYLTFRQMQRKLVSALPKRTPYRNQPKEADSPEHSSEKGSNG